MSTKDRSTVNTYHCKDAALPPSKGFAIHMCIYQGIEEQKSMEKDIYEV
jgi:hypothetical protein